MSTVPSLLVSAKVLLYTCHRILVCVCVCLGERGCSVEERGHIWRDGRVEGSVELTSETEVKLARYNAIRYTCTSV